MDDVVLGVIGGSGIYQMECLEDPRELEIETPFGHPSGPITLGVLNGVRCAFIPRHGRNHSLLPTEVPYRANIYALKSLGCKYVLAVSAVGSLRAHIPPGSISVVGDFIDRTRSPQRLGESTFLGSGLVGYVSCVPAVCPSLAKVVGEVASGLVAQVSHGTTYVCIDGPCFSTRAESRANQAAGGDVVGMTAVPEFRLCREAEMSYAIAAMVTDFDTWNTPAPADFAAGADTGVGALDALAVLRTLAGTARTLVAGVAARIGAGVLPVCPAWTALDGAIMTPKTAIPPEVCAGLAPILSRWMAAKPATAAEH